MERPEQKEQVEPTLEEILQEAQALTRRLFARLEDIVAELNKKNNEK